MKLLNLWPETRQADDPKKQLLLEMLTAFLMLFVSLLVALVWLSWRISDATQANQLLSSEWTRLNQSRQIELTGETQMPKVMRQSLSGQLDWMGDLPEWALGGRVRWVAAKFDDSGLLLEGVALDEVALDEMTEKVRARYPNPPSGVSEISHFDYEGRSLLRFRMKLDIQSVYRRVEFGPNAAPMLTEPAWQQSKKINTPNPVVTGGKRE